MQRYFIFIDETGNNDQEQFFGLGCLLIPIDKMGEYHEFLKQKYGQVYNKVKERGDHLKETLQGDSLIDFLKGQRGSYEMKFKNINTNTQEAYEWLISQYFKFDKAKFCCLVIDKKNNPTPTGMSHFDAYINQLVMLVKNNIEDEPFVVLPDDISVPVGKNYESELISKLTTRHKRNCFGVHRLESHSSLFLQMVDILTGAVVYEFKNGEKIPKKSISQKIKNKLEVSNFKQSFTKNIPNYFSVWIYKNGK